MSDLISDLKKIIDSYSGSVKENKGKYSFEIVIAQRKAFLSTKKLTYSGKFQIDEAEKELTFSEMLKESGIGLSSGDIDSTPGFGFKTSVYKSWLHGRSETIEELSNLFGKKYSYKIDFGSIRKAFEKKATEFGYTFKYNIL
ncbi:MAG: hypothetical protein UV46_C0042G0014 [Candidatus Gottesmanbacteria bacterium GW2011_GWC2_42_8]|nr:MAG: hypothetical protein UV46_C0042G0014 [Candidatus Gottesmanbacteria bacterium GW2011_GWC2_42_8]